MIHLQKGELYVDDPHLQDLCNGYFDRIARDHMSGLGARSHMTAGQDGFRDACS